MKSASPDPKPLNVRQQKFCENVAGGMSATEAYIQAGYKVSKKVAGACGPRLLENVAIQAHIAGLRAPETREAQRKKADNVRFLAEAITTPVSDIGPDSPFCVEYVEEVIGGGTRGKLKRGKAASGNETTGETIIRRRVKKICPLRSIELFSKLLGHFEPDRVELEVGPKTLLSIKERAGQVTSALAGKYAGGKK